MYEFNRRGQAANDPSLILSGLADRWWAFMVRGIAAFLLGIVTLVAPIRSMMALIILWGAYALVDGVLALILAARGARAGARWGGLLFEGVVSIAAGVLTFAWPAITAVALLFVVAFRALATGVAEIAAAVRLRRVIRDEWLLATSGMLSIAFGVLLLLKPASGALALMWLIGGYAIAFAALLVALALRLHSWGHGGTRPTPTGRAPTPA
jgi:uncharacterized membrane protein HdeD (DUF308 family)